MRYEVLEDGVLIRDYYMMGCDAEKKIQLINLCLGIEGLELCRSFDSMFVEWKAHSILHDMGVIKSPDLLIEFRQGKWGAFLCKLTCMLFREAPERA